MKKDYIRNKIHDIVHHDATAGVLMIIIALIALAYSNSPYDINYREWLDTKAGFIFGDFTLKKPILLWVNDGLITLFFFSIGLELKHEFMEGHLSKLSNIALPAFAAIGGIIMPSLIFTLFNFNDEFAIRGWAIPAATDAAFAVAILLLLGNRVPSSLKIFLLSLAIFDDIGAIIIIAIFYTSSLSFTALLFASLSILALAFLNFMRVQRVGFYYIVGTILWFSILKSGVHATLAGIITAFFIPLKKNDGSELVNDIAYHLKMWLAIFILPVFTFANAGINLSSINIDSIFSNVSLGIFLGLFVGKQLGVFLVSYFCIRLGIAKLPYGANYKHLYGVSILTGIGFTMSMFIDGLAYQGSNIFNYANSLAIILGSVVSGIVGFTYLYFISKRHRAKFL